VDRQEVSDNKPAYHPCQCAGEVENIFEKGQKRTVGNKQGKQKRKQTIKNEAAAYPDKSIYKGLQEIRIPENFNIIFDANENHGGESIPLKETYINCKNCGHYEKNRDKNNSGHQISIISDTNRP
jgi:hypothetical protein